MEKLIVKKAKLLQGVIKIPGDKSISHRAIMLGSISKGKTIIKNFLFSEDCISTINCFRKMGIDIKISKDKVMIKGKGMNGLKSPDNILDAGNSGTTTRLILGVLAGQPFTSTITGDKSLRKRPMLRVVHPLRKMGAKIFGRDNGNFAPLTIRGGNLKSIDFVSKIPSAQVKSGVLLAGLFANGITSVKEPLKSRDHTERMLKYFGAKIMVSGLKIRIKGKQELKGKYVNVPGDISSASFFIVAGLIVPNSKIKLLNVGINPTRTGVIDVLKKMNANIKIINKRNLNFEPVGDIIVKFSKLKGTKIYGKIIPRLIDEIPILAVSASVAEGKTVFKDIGELRVKESDRIFTLCSELKKFGVKVKEFKNSMIIYGNSKVKGCSCKSFGDHRIAMAIAILGLIADEETEIKDTGCIKTSFPTFGKILKDINRRKKCIF